MSDQPPFKPLSREDARKHFRALQECDLSSVSIEWLVEQLMNVLKAREVVGTSTFNVGLKLYRARNVGSTKLPLHISELAARPANMVVEHQRCNRSGESMFYCSTDAGCTFIELHVRPRDIVILSEWEATEQLKVRHVGYHADVFKRLGSSRNCPDLRDGVTVPWPELEDYYSFINQFFAEIFINEVAKGNEHLYKMSVAVTEVLLRPMKVLIPDIGFIEHVSHGLIYPSVRLMANCDNLAIKPDFAAHLLKFKGAQQYLVQFVNGPQIHCVPLMRVERLLDSGILEWKRYSPITFSGSTRG